MEIKEITDFETTQDIIDYLNDYWETEVKAKAHPWEYGDEYGVRIRIEVERLLSSFFKRIDPRLTIFTNVRDSWYCGCGNYAEYLRKQAVENLDINYSAEHFMFYFTLSFRGVFLGKVDGIRCSKAQLIDYARQYGWLSRREKKLFVKNLKEKDYAPRNESFHLVGENINIKEAIQNRVDELNVKKTNLSNFQNDTVLENNDIISFASFIDKGVYRKEMLEKHGFSNWYDLINFIKENANEEQKRNLISAIS